MTLSVRYYLMRIACHWNIYERRCYMLITKGGVSLKRFDVCGMTLRILLMVYVLDAITK